MSDFSRTHPRSTLTRVRQGCRTESPTPEAPKLRRRDCPERRLAWVDRAVEAAIPLDDDRAAGVDLADDAAITGPELGIRARLELDHAADSDTRRDARGK